MWGNMWGNEWRVSDHSEFCSPMLTDKQYKNTVCPADHARERLAHAGGLYLEVAPSGSKRWFWKYRFDGKEKRLALGSYPDVGLKDARAHETTRGSNNSAVPIRCSNDSLSD